MGLKKVLKEVAGISFEVREWSNILFDLIQNLDAKESRLIVDGQEYPETFQKFSVDWFVIDFNDWTNGYLDKTSGYDADGNYVVHIMILNQFRKHPYLRTILNHELKHAYEDWQRQTKGYPGIFSSKEVINVYTDDFIKVVKDRIKVGPFFKNILKNYYLLSDLEMNAFMENVYDKDMINDYKKMISRLRNYDALKDSENYNQDSLEKDWQVLTTLNLPFLKKYKDYKTFLLKSTEYFNTKSEKIIRKINKMEYIHHGNLNENHNHNLTEVSLGSLRIGDEVIASGTGYGRLFDMEKGTIIDQTETGAGKFYMIKFDNWHQGHNQHRKCRINDCFWLPFENNPDYDQAQPDYTSMKYYVVDTFGLFDALD